MTTRYVWKGVEVGDGLKEYVSWVNGALRRVYQIGVKTYAPYPETPLLAFATKTTAKRFFRHHRNVVLLKCRAGNVRVAPSVPDTWRYQSTTTTKQARKLWWCMLREDMPRGAFPTPTGTVFCDWVEPIQGITL
jgi:hypothetical protein